MRSDNASLNVPFANQDIFIQVKGAQARILVSNKRKSINRTALFVLSVLFIYFNIISVEKVTFKVYSTADYRIQNGPKCNL